MFYVMTHSTHFLFTVICVGHMVKNQSDSMRGNLLPPHGLLFHQGFFYMQDTTAFGTPVIEHRLEQEIAL